jgi:hypothetical protein
MAAATMFTMAVLSSILYLRCRDPDKMHRYRAVFDENDFTSFRVKSYVKCAPKGTTLSMPNPKRLFRALV